MRKLNTWEDRIGSKLNAFYVGLIIFNLKFYHDWLNIKKDRGFEIRWNK